MGHAAYGTGRAFGSTGGWLIPAPTAVFRLNRYG